MSSHECNPQPDSGRCSASSRSNSATDYDADFPITDMSANQIPQVSSLESEHHNITKTSNKTFFDKGTPTILIYENELKIVSNYSPEIITHLINDSGNINRDLKTANANYTVLQGIKVVLRKPGKKDITKQKYFAMLHYTAYMKRIPNVYSPLINRLNKDDIHNDLKPYLLLLGPGYQFLPDTIFKSRAMYYFFALVLDYLAYRNKKGWFDFKTFIVDPCSECHTFLACLKAKGEKEFVIPEADLEATRQWGKTIKYYKSPKLNQKGAFCSMFK